VPDEQQPFRRSPNTQTASWFLDISSSGRLNLDPPYQRRSVWNLGYRQFFIDSVIRNYPTQAIFLDVDVDPERATEYKVIDGKQRLTSLISFSQDGFPTSQSLADLDLQERYYSDLPREVKSRVLNYLLTVESVVGARSAELNQAFDRLNRNVSRLNKQELRHAQYGGAFITKMERFAELPFWEEVGLVTPARRRRMLDVEYVSELYIIGIKGIQDGKDYLDVVYAEFDEEIDHERRADRLFRGTREFLERIDEKWQISGTRFRNVADFYSLWAAILKLMDDGVPISSRGVGRLKAFHAEIEAGQTTRARDYLLAARQGSNKAANREVRAKMLEDVLRGR
jgi:hypothetical protein